MNCLSLSLNIIGLFFNLCGGIVLGLILIKKNEEIFFGCRNLIDYCLFTNKDKVQKVKDKFMAYYKQNEKDFKEFSKALGEELKEDDYEEYDKYQNIFNYVSSRQARLKGIWGISLLSFGFLLQLIGAFIFIIK